MEKNVMERKIPEDLVILSDAYKGIINSSNRVWLTGAKLTFISIASAGEGRSVPFLGDEFSGFRFFAILAIALSVISFRHCVLQVNMYEMQLTFAKYLRDISSDNIKISESVSLTHAAHRLSNSAYNRFFSNFVLGPRRQ